MATDNLLKQGEDNNDYLISLNKLSSIKIRINEYEENLRYSKNNTKNA